MALIPTSKEGRTEDAIRKTRDFARKHRSHTLCLGCGTYVGSKHSLAPRVEGCVLGSELGDG